MKKAITKKKGHYTMLNAKQQEFVNYAYNKFNTARKFTPSHNYTLKIMWWTHRCANDIPPKFCQNSQFSYLMLLPS